MTDQDLIQKAARLATYWCIEIKNLPQTREGLKRAARINRHIARIARVQTEAYRRNNDRKNWNY